MEIIKKTFKECDLFFLEKTFDLKQEDDKDILTKWIDESKNYEIDEIDNRFFVRLREKLTYRVDNWNEWELIEHFIGPLFSVIDFNTKEYGMFSERLLKATIDNYELSGYPDAIIAKGRRKPEIPYFCFQEYKKEKDPDGDPAGQCLAAMLVAQELNNNLRPLYGVYVVGKHWYFMVLQGKEYAISKGHNALKDEIFEIVKLLKHLKTIIEQYVKESL